MNRITLGICAALLAGPIALAESYALDWHVVAGGGGTSSGGDYTLSGTVGQAEAGTTLSGGIYTLQGGFWPGVILVSSTEAPQLFVQLSGPDAVVSWAPATPGFILEMSGDLNSGLWIPAPTGNPVQVTAADGVMFYRLRRN